MFDEQLIETGSQLRRISVESCWRQWAALGGPAWSEVRPASAVIDLEALLLFSGGLVVHERRFDDMMAWWGRAGSKLVSVQRFRSLSKRFPEESVQGLQSFFKAAASSSDPRWKRFLKDSQTLGSRPAKGPRHPRLKQGPALMARLRAAFGVGVKSDILAFLLTYGSAQSVQQIRKALGYSHPQVSRSCRELALSGFIERTSGWPALYQLNADRWVTVLRTEGGDDGFPTWRFWASLFAFLNSSDGWLRELDRQESRYLASSQARDLYLDFREGFTLNRISVPDPESHPGEAYLSAFEVTLRRTLEWLQHAV